MRITLLLLVSLLPSCYGLFGFIGRKQSVSVSGNLTCNESPAENVLVKVVSLGWRELVLYALSSYPNNKTGNHCFGNIKIHILPSWLGSFRILFFSDSFGSTVHLRSQMRTIADNGICFVRITINFYLFFFYLSVSTLHFI